MAVPPKTPLLGPPGCKCSRCRTDQYEEARSLVKRERARQFSRRQFLGGFSGAAGLLGIDFRQAFAEPSLETTALRLARTSSICQAPQYIVEDLLVTEGFSNVQFVGEATAADNTLVSGDA